MLSEKIVFLNSINYRVSGKRLQTFSLLWVFSWFSLFFSDGYFKHFLFLTILHKNQQMDLKPKKIYFLGYNLLFDIIGILGEAFFISIDEFVDDCSIPHWLLLFDSLLLWGLSLVLVPLWIFVPIGSQLFYDNILHHTPRTNILHPTPCTNILHHTSCTNNLHHTSCTNILHHTPHTKTE